MAVKETQKRFIKAMKKKFAEDPTSQTTKYKYEGYTQSKRKVEFKKAGDAIAKKRGISAYNPMVHVGGIPLGQRQLTPYTVSGTDITVEGDDLHFVNNAAMQQMWDDIRRTVIVGLDVAHMVLEKRLGKAVTPETISNYLAVLNHAMPGAAVVQEHMVETNPNLCDDCYVKVFTGDDELADSIDKQYVLDINKAFPKDQAAALKKACLLVGQSLEVLVERRTKRRWEGRSREGRLVFFEGPGNLEGRTVRAKVEQATPWWLLGSLAGTT